MSFLLSNDSDFVDALRIVRERARKEIGLIVPNESAPARSLREVRPGHIRYIKQSALRGSQFPARVVDELGTFGWPSAWEMQKPLSMERGFWPVSR
ncbi:hypothetical protein [Curtobacterium sp. 9128]|uniref:hypothetical protein n=1 Tax=Curtobacterium sp. 9128 TaxID=1793722 RepID=UPI002481F29E|nr:hypothetical protein [Curtobacterium sp. 9128]